MKIDNSQSPATATPTIPAFVFQLRKPIKYKQRAAATPAPPPPPPTPVNIVSVVRVSQTTVRILFDADPRYNFSGQAGAEFYVDGGGFQFASDGGTNAVELTYDFQNVNVGDPWNLTGQPAWADAPVVFPADGVVEE